MVNAEHLLLWLQPYSGSVQIKDGILEVGRSRSKEGEWYYPLKKKNLPNAFAKVKDERSAIRFVGKYGLLGFLAAFGGTTRREPPDEKGSVYARADRKGMDPLEWMLEQAMLVRFALDLMEKLQSKKLTDQDLKDFLEEKPVGYKYSRIDLVSSSLREFKNRYQIPPDPSRTWGFKRRIYIKGSRDAYEALSKRLKRLRAWSFLGEMITAYTWFIRPRLGRFRPEETDLSITGTEDSPWNSMDFGITKSGIYEYREINSLIEAIWWLVREAALEVSERYNEGADEDRHIRICPCGTPFIATERGNRQKYCPPDDFGSESLCGRKYRRLARMNLNEGGGEQHAKAKR